MSDIALLDKDLNDKILTGKALEAFEQYYADGVVMQENSDEPRIGKDVNRKAEIEFFSSLEAFNDGKLVSSAINGDVTFGEWYMDVTFKGGTRVKMSQVAVRRWKDGKLASEHLYWDQASVLVQIGKLSPTGLPIAGAEVARKVLDNTLPSNALMAKEWQGSEGRPL